MSSEVCPFCGKTYKRLKSHLPHCKAAASSKTPPARRDVATKQTPPSDLAPASAKLTPNAQRSTQTPSVTTDARRNASKKVSALSSKQLQSSTPATSTSILLTTNKKQQKRSKMPNMPSSAPIPPTSPASSELKNKSKSPRVLTDPAAQAETKMSPHNEIKPKDAPEKKAQRIKKAAESLSTAMDASDSLDGDINETSSRSNLWADSVGEIENFSADELLVKSRRSQQGKIVLQDVKATLLQAKTASQSSALGVASQTEAADDLGRKRQKDVNWLVTAKAPSEQLPSSSRSRLTQQQSDRKKSLLCEQASLIPVQHGASPQPKPTSSTTPLLSGHLSPHVTHAAPSSHTVGTSEGLKVSRHMTGLLSASPAPAHVPSPHPFLLAPPVRAETPGAGESVTKEKLQIKVGKQNNAEGSLAQRHLGQVRLMELPEWVACKTPRSPRDVVEMVQRGWQWYHRRYIDVRKGGVGGVGMLLAGYCVLGYVWSYPRIKHDRWRKYH